MLELLYTTTEGILKSRCEKKIYRREEGTYIDKEIIPDLPKRNSDLNSSRGHKILSTLDLSSFLKSRIDKISSVHIANNNLNHVNKSKLGNPKRNSINSSLKKNQTLTADFKIANDDNNEQKIEEKLSPKIKKINKSLLKSVDHITWNKNEKDTNSGTSGKTGRENVTAVNLLGIDSPM